MRHRSLPSLVLFAFMFLCASGCSSDDTAADAKDKCETLIEQFCAGAIDCQVSGGFVDEHQRNVYVMYCMSDTSANLDCSRAVDVTSGYDACLAKVKDPSCDEVNDAIAAGTLREPAACNGVIRTSE